MIPWTSAEREKVSRMIFIFQERGSDAREGTEIPSADFVSDANNTD